MKKEPNDPRTIRGQATKINVKLLVDLVQAIRKRRAE